MPLLFDSSGPRVEVRRALSGIINVAILRCNRGCRRVPPPTARQLPGRRLQPLAAGRGRGGSEGGTNGSSPWGNVNRLGPSKKGGSDKWLPDAETSLLHSIDSVSNSPNSVAPQSVPQWRRALATKMGQLQYIYFNWRQDTWSDLQLFMVLNVLVFSAGAWIEGAVIRNMDDSVLPPPDGAGPLQRLWYDLYRVLAVVLGQDLPAEYAGWPSQLFAIITAVFGLASFALVLALIEQVVLEVLESNVKRGSVCYEQGHTVVLAYCESSRGIAQITRILTQLCAANRTSGGGVVVVLTQQRGKLEMEQLYREVVPQHHRFGTRFVFRQGSPLDPAALKLVAVPDARSVVVCTDYSKPSRDGDAQTLRTCVLVDELVQQERPGQAGPIVAAQIKSEGAMALVKYACSKRVVPVPTNKLNARRYVRLLHHPIAAVFSRSLSDFYSPAHGSIDRVPEVEGCTFGELHFRFPDAIVVGTYSPSQKSFALNPPPETVLQPGDEIICLRPESAIRGQYHALPEAVSVDMGKWDPSKYILRSHDDQPLGNDLFSSADACMALSARALEPASELGWSYGGETQQGSGASFWEAGASQQAQGEDFQSCAQGLYVLPAPYRNNLCAGDELLICGWMGNTFMLMLLAELDHSDQALPAGSRVTLFNNHDWTPEVLKARCKEAGIRNLIVQHVKGDPRSRSEMCSQIDVTNYKAAIVVCDSLWADDGLERPNADGGLRLLSQAEMLSLDAAMLMVQLNIRLALEEARHPNISIICEKLTYVGVTRFEDDARLPMGIAINSASYAAKALTQVAVDPRFLTAYLNLGRESDLTVQDASAFAAEGEELSFLQLQARTASVRQVLMGWYRIPDSASQPLEMVVNPQGLDERLQLRVWNAGDSRLKLVTMAKRRDIENASTRSADSESARSAYMDSARSSDCDYSFFPASVEDHDHSTEDHDHSVGDRYRSGEDPGTQRYGGS